MTKAKDMSTVEFNRRRRLARDTARIKEIANGDQYVNHHLKRLKLVRSS